ncbi:MAG: hypothetical protein FWD79_10045 [Desulfobulbus sp.]|nr:hypothetical protein [Desulfobulbus sp.]
MKKIGGQGRAIVIVVGVAAVFVLPSLLGRFMLSRAQDLAAHHLHTSLEADSCSLSWVGGLQCEQIRYQDPERGVRFEASRLSSDKGLLLLLAAPSYLGDITVEQPVLTFLAPLPPPESSSDMGLAKAASALDGDDRQKSRAPSWWERLSFRFKATGGQIAIAHDAGPDRQIARQFEFDGSLAMGSVHFDLSFLSPQQSGRLRAAGSINLPLAGQSLPEMAVTDAEVTIVDLEIADFLQLAASRSQTPNGRGILNATLHLNVAGIREFEAKGEATLRDVQLAGGVFGEDHPQVEEIDFRFAGGHRQEDGWRLETLELRSAPVRLSAKGDFNAGAGNLSVTGSLNLPVLAAQAPKLLSVHEQTMITEGAVDFSLAATGSGQAMTIRADCRTEHLSLVHGARSYSWTSPLAIAAEAGYSAGNMTVRSLHVQTPFFEAQGGGAIDGFSLQGSGDLERMSQDLKTIFDFGAQAKGRLELTAATKKTAGGDIGCKGRLVIRDFAWAQGKKSPLPSHDLQISGQAVIAPSFLQDKAIDSLQIEVSAWPGRFSLRAGGMRQHLADAENNCALQGDVDLERLSDAMQRLRGDTLFPALKGALKFDGSGSCTTEAQMTLRNMRGTVERLAIIGPGADIREPNVRFALGGIGQPSRQQVGLRELTVAASQRDLDTQETPQETPFFQVDGARRRLTVQGLGWASAGTNLTVGGAIKDWQRPTSDFSASFKGETSAALLGGLVRSIGWLPADMRLAGTARGALLIDASAGRSRSEVTLDLTSFALMSGQRKLFADPHLLVYFVLDKEGRSGKTTKIPSLILRSTPLSIEGTGSIADAVPPVLDMQGRMTCDYAAFLPMLSLAASRDIAVSGTRTADILLSLPLQWPVPMERLTFSAQLPVDSLALQGIGFKPLVVSVDCNLGRLRCRLDGQLEDGGQATLEPVWNLTGPQPALSLPPDGQVVQDAALKPALIRLLGRLHPLFGCMAYPQGMIDVRPTAFSFSPAGKGAQWPAFAMALSMNRVKFKPTGALHELLALAGMTQEWLSCKEQEMVCEGKEGRVRCDPVRLLAGDREISLQGEMLPDGALRYRVRLPMSPQLTEKAQLVVQGRTTIEAEIRGDRQQPAFDAATFLADLSAQLRQQVEVEPAAGAKQ